MGCFGRRISAVEIEPPETEEKMTILTYLLFLLFGAIGVLMFFMLYGKSLVKQLQAGMFLGFGLACFWIAISEFIMRLAK